MLEASSISVFDLFTIGIGPSSSHAVGPMRAAACFLKVLADGQMMEAVSGITVKLFGSLALTGRGHGTDKAVVLGLEGELPETVNPERIPRRFDEIAQTSQLRLAGWKDVPFDLRRDLAFLTTQNLPRHPNGLQFSALAGDGSEVLSRQYYSIGGGFVLEGDAELNALSSAGGPEVPFPFSSAAQLLEICRHQNLPFSQVILRNELARRDSDDINRRLDAIWNAMQECVERGCNSSEQELPGGLRVRRRAAKLYQQLSQISATARRDPLEVLDWVDLFALAVNEENAAGGRVVTAPTNGAAGIVPAVMHYYDRFCPKQTPDGIHRFLLTAGGIAMLYKRNASISGAEVGCQGEVGVACSMAAGALTEVLGGTPEQVETAAEIGMEHNLGLTCDPVKGLVQVPCIERNAMGAVKAINAARLALRGDGQHKISLDRVIEVMRRTGADMLDKYKETSRGGLAVNFTEC